MPPRSSLLTFSSALLFALILLLNLIHPASAATPTSFCKCTCFKKSYIIALDPPSSKNNLPGSAGSSAGAGTSPNIQSGDDLPRSIFAPRDAEPEEGDEEGSGDGGGKGKGKGEYKAKTCTDCNRQFCLALDLPICKGAVDEDVTTSCFQRDSSKDEAVVFIFIIATVSLLGWALIRPFVHKYMQQAKERRSYIPITNEQDQP